MRLTSLIVVTSICASLISSPAYSETSAIPVTELELTSGTIAVRSASGENLSTTADEYASNKTVLDSSNHSIRTGYVDDSSLQLLILIENAYAPSSYEFAVDGAESFEHLETAEGSIYRIVGSDGATNGWLSEPWAHDARGVSVPTYYEFAANKIVQHIDLSDSSIEFPVTADPFLGAELIKSVSYSVHTATNTRNLKIAVSPWLGMQYSGTLTGSILMWSYGTSIAQTYGWSEVLDKFQAKYGLATRSYITSRSTYKNQWDCHALGAPLIFAATVTGFDTSPTWDLEGRRAPNTNTAVWVASRCSW